jgi:hypothetical protein
MTGRSRLRLSGVVALAAAVGVATGLALAGGAGGAAPGVQPSPEALKELKRLRSEIGHAQDGTAGGREAKRHIKWAVKAKRDFIIVAFNTVPDQGCRLDWVYERLDEVDVWLEAAAYEDSPTPGLQGAKKAAAIVAKNLSEQSCLGGPGGAAAAMKLKKLIDGLADEDKGPSKAHRAKATSLKKGILAGRTAYGCDAVEFWLQIEAIDVQLYLATGLGRTAKDRAEYDRLVDGAMRAAKRLIELWNRVPCDEPGQPTTTTTGPSTTTTGTDTTTTTGTGTTTTTTPPPSPQCSDGSDNDADVQTDFPTDSGCLSAQDTTEATTDWPFHYPGDSFTGTDWIDLKPFFGAFGNSVEAYRVFFNPTVHDSATPNHGATPISGTMPCPSLSDTEIRAGIGDQAPTGPPLPAAPDSDHLRIVIDTEDAPGGGTCGSGTVNLTIAVDTR